MVYLHQSPQNPFHGVGGPCRRCGARATWDVIRQTFPNTPLVFTNTHKSIRKRTDIAVAFT